MSIANCKKALTKADIATGFITPTEWLTTGIYTLNYIMSGRFNVGIPNKRMTMLWGQSGCFDSETEYMSPTGWKRIADYQQGELVGQYNKDTGVMSFTQPTDYIKEECNEFYHFKTARGIDMMLTPEHRVLYQHENGEMIVETAQEVADAYNNKTFTGSILSYCHDTDERHYTPFINECDDVIELQKASDGYKYCFSVPDTFLVMRRKSKIFVSGNSGKSFFAGHIAKDAQAKGYHVFYIDTETAADVEYLTKIGVSCEDKDITIATVTTIEEATETMSVIFQNLEPTDKVCIIIDSLSNLLTDKEVNDFDKGVQKGDMGQQAKKLKLFVKNINNKIGKFDAFCIGIGHAYRNQDIMNGEGVWKFSGGDGTEFLPSISVRLTKLKLKEATDIVGVKITAETTKSRYTKLGGRIVIEVPYDKGFDKLSGLLEMAKDAGLVSQAGAWYSYELDGKVVKFQSKKFSEHYQNLFSFDEDEPIDVDSEEEKV